MAVPRKREGDLEREFKRAMQEAHGRIATTYGGYGREGPGPLEGRLREVIADLLHRHSVRPSTTALLDLGCGNGAFLDLFHDLGFRSIVGLDIARPMLTVSQRRGGRRWTLVQGDAEELPFRGDSFDLVHMYGVLQHLQHPERTLGEVARVLTKGGLALVDVPQRGSASYYTHLLMAVPTTQWGNRGRWLGWADLRAKARTYRFFTLAEFRGLVRGLPLTVLEEAPTVYLSLHGPLARLYDEILPVLRARHGPALESATRRIFRIPSGQLVLLRRS